jgi:hypothetical protein
VLALVRLHSQLCPILLLHLLLAYSALLKRLLLLDERDVHDEVSLVRSRIHLLDILRNALGASGEGFLGCQSMPMRAVAACGLFALLRLFRLRVGVWGRSSLLCRVDSRLDGL